MDYRNADGSLAEMCGNGIRVMARYLVDRGHQGAGIFAIDTRDGLKYLAVPESGEISVNMGKVLDLSDVDGSATILQSGHEWKSFNINAGNPHAVAIISDLDQVGDLTAAPVVLPDDIYPDGVNIEFVEITSDNEVQMRVYERGSGETRSCGTGICAVALAANIYSKRSLPAKWIVNPPGGRLTVELDPHSNATLTGAAVILQDFEVEI
jgi:diaminopimelate epimerase